MKEKVIINDIDVTDCRKLMLCNNGNIKDKTVKQEYRCSIDAKLCEEKTDCDYKKS